MLELLILAVIAVAATLIAARYPAAIFVVLIVIAPYYGFTKQLLDPDSLLIAWKDVLLAGLLAGVFLRLALGALSGLVRGVLVRLERAARARRRRGRRRARGRVPVRRAERGAAERSADERSRHDGGEYPLACDRHRSPPSVDCTPSVAEGAETELDAICERG